jgi:two-component system alkaline phosphatase synthesis response regulator PhoP
MPTSHIQDQFDVFVIDDNFEQANILKLLIEQFGYRVKFTTDSKSALQKIKKYQPRLVILDLMMPGVDGLRLCKMLKENPQTHDIKIIIYSGKLYDSDRRKAMMLGADLFLTKPTRAHVLLDSIKGLLLPVTHEILQN